MLFRSGKCFQAFLCGKIEAFQIGTVTVRIPVFIYMRKKLPDLKRGKVFIIPCIIKNDGQILLDQIRMCGDVFSQQLQPAVISWDEAEECIDQS